MNAWQASQEEPRESIQWLNMRRQEIMFKDNSLIVGWLSVFEITCENAVHRSKIVPHFLPSFAEGRDTQDHSWKTLHLLVSFKGSFKHPLGFPVIPSWGFPLVRPWCLPDRFWRVVPGKRLIRISPAGIRARRLIWRGKEGCRVRESTAEPVEGHSLAQVP